MLRVDVDIEVFGGLAVLRGGHPQTIGGPRQRRLLAALVAERDRVVAGERLIDILWWGDEVPDAADRTLQSYVSRLRATLGGGEDVLRREYGGYRLRVDASSVSAERFVLAVRRAQAPSLRERPDEWLNAVEAALDLWRGQPYGDLAAEPFLVAEVARLTELRAALTEARVDALLASGSTDEAVAEAELLMAESPLRERPYHLAMQALYRTGRAPEALRTYQRFRALLASETGLEPSAALRDLEDAVIAGRSLDDAHGTAPRTNRLADFRLGDVIGGGATSTVHRAVQLSTGREVAVKAIRPELLRDPAAVKRFDTEVQLLAQVEHPNLVTLVDAWRDGEGAWIVTQLLRGGSLASQLLTGGPWTLSRVAALIEQVGGALETIHRSGVVHGDISPANVLFDGEGRAYLADVGIAGPRPGGGWRADLAGLSQLVIAALAGQPLGEGDPVETLRVARPDLPGEIFDLVDAERVRSLPSVAALTSALLSLAAGATSTRPVSNRNPFKALRAYREADVTDFFGRERLVHETIAALAVQRFVTVVGPSGSGKSSLVRAGVLPRYRTRADPAPVTTTMLPGTAPLEELEAALLRVALNPPPSLQAQLAAGPSGLVRAAKRVLAEDSELLLVVDQFEELWTHVTDEAVRIEFLWLLATAASDDRSPVRVLATLRADFVDAVLADPTAAELFRAGTVLLPPLTPTELERAVRGPLDLVGLDVEPALLARLVAETASRPGALPLLQFSLWQLVEQRDPTGSMLTLAAHDAAGGVGGTLAARAETHWSSLNYDERAAVRRLFRRLVTPGVDRADTRRRVELAEVVDIADRVIDGLVSERLVTIDRVAGRATIELAHEVLLRSWPRLAIWIDEDRDGIRLLRHLADAVATWVDGGRDPADLYRGRRLELALAWTEAHPEELSAVEREFLAASVDGEAGHEIARLLEASDRALDTDWRSALRLAVAAHDRRPDIAALGAVQAALLASDGTIIDLPPGADMVWLDERTLIVAEPQGLRFWDIAVFQETGFVELPDVTSLAVDRSRSAIVAGTSDGKLVCVDIHDRSVRSTTPVDAAVLAVSCNQEGRIVAGLLDGTVLVGGPGALVPAAHLGLPVIAVAASPVGVRIAASTGGRGHVVEIDLASGSISRIPMSYSTESVAMTGAPVVGYDNRGRLITGLETLEIFDQGTSFTRLNEFLFLQSGTVEVVGEAVIAVDSARPGRRLSSRQRRHRHSRIVRLRHA